MSFTHISAYQAGYLAACTKQPRKAPAAVRRVLPRVSESWFHGYDEGKAEEKATQARVAAEGQPRQVA